MLLRAIAWCFHFIRNYKSRSYREEQPSLQLQASKIETAESQFIWFIKMEAFSDVYSFLSGGKGNADKIPLLVSHLDLFLDENGIIRVCLEIHLSQIKPTLQYCCQLGTGTRNCLCGSVITECCTVAFVTLLML